MFNTGKTFEIHSYGEDFENNMTKTRTSRTLFFGITYKLNDGLKQKKKMEEQSMDEF